MSDLHKRLEEELFFKRFHRYLPDFTGYARSLAEGHGDIVPDILAAAEMKAMKNNKPEMSDGEFAAFVKKLIFTCYTDYCRHKSVFGEDAKVNPDEPSLDFEEELPDESEEISESAELADEAEKMLEYIRDHPSKNFDVLRYRLDGMTFGEIAKQLSVPVSTCKARFVRAVRGLARMFGDEDKK